MKLFIAFFAVVGLSLSLVLSFLAGGVVGVGVGYETAMSEQNLEEFNPAFDVDMGHPMPIGELYHLPALERMAEDMDFIPAESLFQVSQPFGGICTVTCGDYQAEIEGNRDDIGDTVSVVYLRIADGEHDAQKAQAIVYALSQLGSRDASTYLGLSSPGPTYPDYPAEQFLVSYLSKLNFLLLNATII